MKKFRGYIFSRSFMNERVPQAVQNLVIRDYCMKNKIQYLLSSTEYAMESSFLMLKKILKDIKKIDGIVAYSLFQLPENLEIRNNVYEEILSNKKEIHFALENIKLKGISDIVNIENIWNIKTTLPKCIQGFKY